MSFETMVSKMTDILSQPQCVDHKQLETYVCIVNTVETHAPVLKHQAISTHSAD